MDLEIFVTAGLGDASYLVASNGEAALVDPQRDAWRFLAVAERRGWRLRHILETHVHNDYLSGALEARAATGAGIVAPARGAYEFPHRGVDHGDRVELGGLVLTAVATPGHTPEHLAWTVARADRGGTAGDVEQRDVPQRDGAGPDAVFTGGSLLVGSAGRTDLLGPALEPALTADQARTLRRLALLRPGVRVLPTHGSGSFCTAGPAVPRPTTTLGEEHLDNPLLRAAEAGEAEAAFRERLLGSLGRFPAYYAHMAPLNRVGPRVLGGLTLPPALGPEALEAAVAHGATVVDARSRVEFAGAHLPGSLNVELEETFGPYVGWLVPFGAPIVLVLPEPVADAAVEATSQLLRIGYEDLRGILAGGVEAWAASGRPTRSYPTISIRRVEPGADETLLDVRQPVEWRDEGMIPGSTGIFVADLPERLGELPRDRPMTVLCKSGSRAAIAASILDAANFDVRLVARGGAPSWPGTRAPGPPLSPP